RLPGGERFTEARQPAREAVEDAEGVERDSFQTRMLAAAFGFLPQRFALARQGQIFFGPEQDEMVDNLRRQVERGQRGLEIARLARALGEEEADADLPRLAVLARPVRDGDDAVGGMIAEGEFRDDVLQPPRADFDAVLVAD